MPNGFVGQQAEWDRMEAPLLRVDHQFEAFAGGHGLQVRRNYHNWPERSLVWNTANINKMIQVFLHDGKTLTFTFWICAYEDRGAKRYWKQKRLREAVTMEEISPGLDRLLTDCKALLDDWKEADLVPVSELNRDMGS